MQLTLTFSPVPALLAMAAAVLLLGRERRRRSLDLVAEPTTARLVAEPTTPQKVEGDRIRKVPTPRKVPSMCESCGNGGRDCSHTPRKALMGDGDGTIGMSKDNAATTKRENYIDWHGGAAQASNSRLRPRTAAL